MASKAEVSLWWHNSVFLYFSFGLGCPSVPVCTSSGWLRSPGPPLQHRGPLKPSAATARGGRWCATDVFTVRFQTAAFPFFRLFFLYLSSPWGRLTAHNPGGGSLRESPCTELRGRALGQTCGQHLLLQRGARFGRLQQTRAQGPTGSAPGGQANIPTAFPKMT